jgi:hypothetical protein
VPAPCCRADAVWAPEWLGIFAKVQDLQAGRHYRGDELAKGPLPFHGPAGWERVIDEATAEVTTILPDARQILVPRPQGRGRMRLEDEQVPGGPEQPGDIASPSGQAWHPDQGAFPGVDEVGAGTGQWRPGTVATTYRQAAPRSSARRCAARTAVWL